MPTSSIIFIVSVLVSFPALFSALTVKLKTPSVVGVPEMMPLPKSVNPLGRLPFNSDHVMVAVPVAASV